MALSDEITNAYQKYLGRAPDPGGLDYWTNVAGSQGLDKAIAGISGSSEAQQSGAKGSELDLSFLEGLGPESSAKAFSGLPEWGQNTLESVIGNPYSGLTSLMNYFPAAFQQAWPNINNWIAATKTESEADYAKSLQDILDSISKQKGSTWGDYTSQMGGIQDLIEKTRQLLPKNYESSINYNMNQNLKPKISDLSGKGVLSSSVAADSLAKVMQAANADYMDKVNQANTWAAQANLGTSQDAQKFLAGLNTDQANKILTALANSQAFTAGLNKDTLANYTANLKDQVAGLQKQGSLLGSLLELAKYSQSESGSENPLAAYSLLLPMLMG